MLDEGTVIINTILEGFIKRVAGIAGGHGWNDIVIKDDSENYSTYSVVITETAGTGYHIKHITGSKAEWTQFIVSFYLQDGATIGIQYDVDYHVMYSSMDHITINVTFQS